MVMRGNCTFYEKVRLAQINGARGLLIVSRERLVSLLLSLYIADTPLVLDIVFSAHCWYFMLFKINVYICVCLCVYTRINTCRNNISK